MQCTSNVSHKSSVRGLSKSFFCSVQYALCFVLPFLLLCQIVFVCSVGGLLRIPFFGLFLFFGSVFSSTKGRSEAELEKEYFEYAKSFGDCEAPKDVSAHHGFWELVGQRAATNSYCGSFQKLKICNRVELHGQSDLSGVSHVGDVFAQPIYRSCNSPLCSVCCFSGWARRLADHATQRIEAASKRFGKPQHIVVPAHGTVVF